MWYDILQNINGWVAEAGAEPPPQGQGWRGGFAASGPPSISLRRRGNNYSVIIIYLIFYPIYIFFNILNNYQIN